MRLVVNGQPSDLRDGGTVGDLLKAISVAADRVAILLNDEVVPRQERGERVLKDGDRVELLVFAPGG